MHFSRWKCSGVGVSTSFNRQRGLISYIPDSKVHGAQHGAHLVLSAPDGPHVGPMNLAIRDHAMHWHFHSYVRCLIDSHAFCCYYRSIYIIEIVTKISIIEYLNLSCVLHYWGWIAFSYQMQIIWIKTTAFISYDKWEKAKFPKPQRRRKNTFLRSNLDIQLNSLDR